MNSRRRSIGRRGPRGLLWAMAAVAGLLGIGAGPAEAGWTGIGPYIAGASVSAFALAPTTPTTLYAGTDGYSVFKWT
jgi:hypothetical protein